MAGHVDQLEEALARGWRVPGTRRKLVDAATMLELIDQIRVTLPEQLQAAQRLLEDQDATLAAARAEARAVLARARQQAQRRLADEVSIRAVADRAAQIEAQAWRRADWIEQQGDEAAAERLHWLRAQLDALAHRLPSEVPPYAAVAERRAAPADQATDADRQQAQPESVKEVRRGRPVSGRTQARMPGLLGVSFR